MFFASGHKGIIRMLGARARRLLPHLGSCAWFRQQVDFDFKIVDFQQFESDTCCRGTVLGDLVINRNHVKSVLMQAPVFFCQIS